MLLNININSALAVRIHSIKLFDKFNKINDSFNTKGLNLVLKKQSISDMKEPYLETCSTQCHSLVEDFVNGCAYHMWSAIP